MARPKKIVDPNAEKKPRKPRHKPAGNANPYTNGTKTKEDLLQEQLERRNKKLKLKHEKRQNPPPSNNPTPVGDLSDVQQQVEEILSNDGRLVLDSGDVPMAIRMLSVAAKAGGRKDTLEVMYVHAKKQLLKIFQFISLGASDYIAAEALGVTHSTFKRWLEIGEKQYLKMVEEQNFEEISVHCWFYLSVMENKAKSRVIIEMEMRQGDLESKRFWLKNMAKTKGDREGWDGNTVTIQGNPEKPLEVNTTVNEGPKIQDLAQTMLVLNQLGIVKLDEAALDKTIEGQTTPPSLPEK